MPAARLLRPNLARSRPGRVIKTLQPGAPGTKRLVYRHGELLVCVRYREDATGTTRYTTVEFIVDEGPLRHRAHGATIVSVEIPFALRHLRQRAIAMGAEWDEEQRLWRMPWHAARTLGLEAQVQTRRRRR